MPMLSHSMPKRIVSMPDRSYLCHNDTWLNSTMPLRLNALLCRGYTCPCQCSATPLVCYSMPKRCISLHSPRFTLLSQNHAPLSHGNTLPGPFIAIRCLYFTMPVLTSRCSASAIRFLSLPLRDASSPCPCTANPCFASSDQCLSLP